MIKIVIFPGGGQNHSNAGNAGFAIHCAVVVRVKPHGVADAAVFSGFGPIAKIHSRDRWARCADVFQLDRILSGQFQRIERMAAGFHPVSACGRNRKAVTPQRVGGGGLRYHVVGCAIFAVHTGFNQLYCGIGNTILVAVKRAIAVVCAGVAEHRAAQGIAGGCDSSQCVQQDNFIGLAASQIVGLRCAAGNAHFIFAGQHVAESVYPGEIGQFGISQIILAFIHMRSGRIIARHAVQSAPHGGDEDAL